MRRKIAPALAAALLLTALCACQPPRSGPEGAAGSGPAGVVSGEPAADWDAEAAKAALEAVWDYEPGSAGSSLKLYIAAAKLLNFTETYDDATQKRELSDATAAYLGGLTEEERSRFAENLPAVISAAKEIAAGGGDVAERLDEAGNPQEYEAYTALKLEAAAEVVDGCLQKRP